MMLCTQVWKLDNLHSTGFAKNSKLSSSLEIEEYGILFFDFFDQSLLFCFHIQTVLIILVIKYMYLINYMYRWLKLQKFLTEFWSKLHTQSIVYVI